MLKGALILEEFLDLAETDEKLKVRMYAPVQEAEGTWACRLEIGEPIDISGNAYGASALQALALGLKRLSIELYAHPLWRDGKVGAFGELGGYLGLPAPASYHDFAPYEF